VPAFTADVALGLSVELEEIEGATEWVAVTVPMDAEGAVGANGGGVGRSLMDET